MDRSDDKIYKKWWFYLIVIFFVAFFVVGVPLIINEVYKVNSGYLTLWDAADVLSFYAVILSGLITIGALIVTIYYSKKDIERQIKFYRSQVKTPFFVIADIHNVSGENRFKKSDSRTWRGKYQVDTDGTISFRKQEKIEILLENIGDGIALSPYYKIDTVTGTKKFNLQVAYKNLYIALPYDLQENLHDKLIEHHTSTMDSLNEIDTGITFFYQNTFGIEFKQQIKLSLKFELETNTAIFTLNEASPQETLN